MKVNAIVAIGNDNQMGMFGKLPWHNQDDLKWFRDQVEGNPIICGRKTYEGLPSWIKNKCDIAVVSSTIQEHPTFKTLKEALEYQCAGDEDVWICGGRAIYEESIRESFLDDLYVTRIDYSGYADTFFPQYNLWASDKHCERIELGSCYVNHYSESFEILRPSPSGLRGRNIDSVIIDESPHVLPQPAGLNYMGERPDEPNIGDAYFDVDQNCVMVYSNDGWLNLTAGEYLQRPTVQTEIVNEIETASSSEMTAEEIRLATESVLNNFVGEINDETSRLRIQDALERLAASVYNQNINDIRSQIIENDDFSHTVSIEIPVENQQTLLWDVNLYL